MAFLLKRVGGGGGSRGESSVGWRGVVAGWAMNLLVDCQGGEVEESSADSRCGISVVSNSLAPCGVFGTL